MVQSTTMSDFTDSGTSVGRATFQNLIRRLSPWKQRGLTFLEIAALCLLLTGSSFPPAQTTAARSRNFTRAIEFDFAGWMLHSLQLKFFDTALNAPSYTSTEMQRKEIGAYIQVIGQIFSLEGDLNRIYADPTVSDPQAASQLVRAQLQALYDDRDKIAPLAEGVLQMQINAVATETGLTVGGQAIPPVLYRSISLPSVLIISPRNVIRQDAQVDLVPDLPLDRRVDLETRVDQALDVSSLVVNLGGVGSYPTMVAETTNFPWLCEVVSHEWIHNYLTLRPLGMNYTSSPELRIMNETTAAIAGKEMGLEVLKRYYPELAPQENPAAPVPAQPAAQPPAFNFNKEMHLTRITVDKLLADGQVTEAEAYMDARRKVFWDNGYTGLRKLNQAYFAFHGAYADEPEGPAGQDPVGAAVRKLRAQSPSLKAFLEKIAWMYSFETLQQAVASAP